MAMVLFDTNLNLIFQLLLYLSMTANVFERIRFCFRQFVIQDVSVNIYKHLLNNFSKLVNIFRLPKKPSLTDFLRKDENFLCEFSKLILMMLMCIDRYTMYTDRKSNLYVYNLLYKFNFLTLVYVMSYPKSII